MAQLVRSVRRLSLGAGGAALLFTVATTSVGATAPTPGGAAVSANLIHNGGFEQSNGYSPIAWTTSGAANDFTGAAHRGTRHMDLLNMGSASVSQNVTIPAGITSATLSYWEEDFSCGTPLRLEVHLVAAGTDHLLQTVSGATCGSGYVRKAVTVTKFAGMPVTVRFVVPQSGGGDGSLFYLDDVALTTR